MQADPEQRLRRALGAFPTGVIVVTAARPDGRLSAITVNSLASVSLSPPLILWCLGDKSERYDSFALAPIWGVTVLGADEDALARRFARTDAETLLAAEAESFAGAPVLNGAGIAHFACRTHDRRLAGDHLIIIGEVLDFRAQPGAALSFFRGRYGRAAESGDA